MTNENPRFVPLTDVIPEDPERQHNIWRLFRGCTVSEWRAETAEWYAANYGESATNRLAANRLDPPADALIVDVGCGRGAALRHASQRVSRGRLIGVDLSPGWWRLPTSGPRVIRRRIGWSSGLAAQKRCSLRMASPVGSSKRMWRFICGYANPYAIQEFSTLGWVDSKE